jgi:hypothetical protein
MTETEKDITKMNFDIEPLLNEVKTIIETSINNLLKDFVEKYKLYEETYNGVLNLPAVRKINQAPIQEREKINANEMDMFETTKQIVKEEVKTIENNILMSIQELTVLNAKRMNEQFHLLNNELKELKQKISNNEVVDLTGCDSDVVTEEEIVIKEEKENIILNIHESDNECEKNMLIEQQEEEEEQEEEQEEDDEEQEEDDEEQEEDEEQSEVEEEQDEEQDEVDEEQSEVEEQPEVEEQSEEEEVETENEVDEEQSEEEQPEVEEQEEEQKEEQPEVEETKNQEEEEEFFEIEIDDVTYCTNDEENGIIYELSSEGDIGKKVGFLLNGEATFYE